MLSMNLRRAAILIAAGLLLCTRLPASTRYMPVAEVKPGMEGVGRTVFAGDAIEAFNVHILGVLKNGNAPQRDLILARLEGGPLAKTGVIAGMSGSPVYVDGRLIGAVSYSVGQFSTEPIAGITPIDEMVSATADLSARSPRGATRWPDMARSLERAGIPALRASEPYGAAGAPFSFTGDAGVLQLTAAATLRPIALPITTSGIELSSTPALADVFRNAGFALAPPGSAVAQAGPAGASGPALRPGDPVGIALIDGDMSFGATGTVTDVDGDRVYAFGHPLYNVGPAHFPMTRAYVHAVLPSLLSSMKLSSIGAIVGTIRQDRSTAVAGVLGEQPRQIPMTVAIRREDGPVRTLRFGVAVDPLLSPLLIFTALFNTISAHEHDFGPATYGLTGRISVAGQQPVDLDEIFVGDQPGSAVSAAVSLPTGTLLNNDREAVTISGIELTLAATERPRTATIERAWFDGTPMRRGRTAKLNVLLRTWRGESLLESVQIPIPINPDGPLSVLVSDGPRLAQWEARDGRPTLGPESVATIIRRLNETRHANRVYIRLVGRQEGAIVGNESLPALPASVLSVLASDRAGGGGTTIQNVVLGGWDIKTAFAVSGQRTLPVAIDSDRN